MTHEQELQIEGDEAEVVGGGVFGVVDVVRDGGLFACSRHRCGFDLDGEDIIIDPAPQVCAGSVHVVDFDAIPFKDIGGEELSLPPCISVIVQGPRSVGCFA